MKYKKIMMLAILILALVTVSAVGATDNATDNVVSADNSTDDLVSEDAASEDVVSVEEKCDDVGESDNSEILSIDDGSVFQRKIDETPSGGILVLNKDYTFDSYSIIIDKPMTIDGAGHSLKTNTISDNYFINVRSDNVVLKNIIFRGIYSTKGIIAWSGANGKLDSCTFSSNKIYGQSYFRAHIFVGRDIQYAISWGGINGTINNSKFSSNDGDPLIYLSASNTSISNCVFSYNKNSHSIETSSNIKDCIIDNCIFENCNSTQGIIYNHANQTVIKDCKFMDNIGIVVYFHDYQFNNRTSGYNSHIVGSIFIDNVGSIIVSNAKSCSITDSIILDYPNNRDSLIYIQGNEEFHANYNWWGNTLNNKFNKPYYGSGVQVNHWLFLNDTDYMHNPDKNLINSFYDCHLNEKGNKIVRKYHSSSLPEATLEYSSSNNAIDKFSLKFDGFWKTYSFDAHKIVIAGTFTELNNLIKNSLFYVNLNKNYSFYEFIDYDLIDGIDIGTRHIMGNGFTIDGSNLARIFNVQSYTVFNDLNLVNARSDNGAAIMGTGEIGFSVFNSNFTNNHAAVSGGAMYNGHAVNCSFINNIANYGGAIYRGAAENCIFVNNVAVEGGAVYDVYAINSTFANNTATNSCGAMYNNSAVNCTFIKNSANNNSGALGFGYALNCSFIDNYALKAGAFGFGHADFCIFENNHANEGGAMFEGDSINCTFIGNYANQGGAISGDVEAYNCIFENNHATKKGGAVFDCNAEKCVLNGNYAKSGGAIYEGCAVNCTFVNNTSTDGSGPTCECELIKCIFKALTKITSQMTTVTYNGDSNIVAKLINADTGKAISNTNIVFKINNAKSTVKTDSKGQARLSTNGLNPCEYTATISYAGNSKYASSTKSVKVIVKKADTSISAIADSTELIATLTHGITGKAISGAKIVVNINGKNHDLKTDSNGQARLLSPSSDYTAVVSYGGNAKYNPSNITVKTKTKIIISAVYDANYKELVVTLTNKDTGKVVSSANVQVNLNGVDYDLKTNSKGQTKVSAADLPLGTYPATISYAGNSKYNPASISIIVDVRTKVIVTDVYEYSNKLVASLTNGATGSPITNANMVVDINGVKTTVKSDSKGQISLDTSKLGQTAYDVTISYGGNSRYTPSSATVAIDLNKANMNIKYSYNADTKELVATLKNSKTGKVVSNANMVVDINGVKTTLKSNNKGQIIFSTADFAPGTHVGTITYGGNDRYNSISAAFKVDV